MSQTVAALLQVGLLARASSCRPRLRLDQSGQTTLREADVLGTTYVSDYEPIKDASVGIIGVYFVGVILSKVAFGDEGEVVGATTQPSRTAIRLS